MEEQIPILNEYNTSGWEGAQGSTTAPYQKFQIEPIPDIPIPKVIDLTDKMKPANFNVKSNNHYYNNSSNREGLVDWSQLDANKGKIIISEQVPLTETHTKSSDGETWQPKTETYIQGTNNEKRIANEQKNSQTTTEPLLDKFETDSTGGNIIIAGGIALFVIYVFSKVFKS